MGVARQVGEDRLGTAKGPLGIDDPFARAQRRSQRRNAAVCASGELAEEAQHAGVMRLLPALPGNAAGTAVSTRTGREEATPAGNPALPVGRQAATEDDAVT